MTCLPGETRGILAAEAKLGTTLALLPSSSPVLRLTSLVSGIRTPVRLYIQTLKEKPHGGPLFNVEIFT